MGKFFQWTPPGAAGPVVGLAVTDEDEARYLPAAPTNASPRFDETANAQHVTDFQANPSRYTFAAGVLQKDGVAAVFAADLPLTVQRKGSFAGGVRVAADRSTSGVAFVDVPDLQFQLDPNSNYAFTFDGAYTAAAGTTGLQLGVSGPASPSFLGVGFEVATSPTLMSYAFAGAYDAGAAPTTSGGATPLPFHVYGTISTGAAGGTLRLRGKSSANGSAVTIKRGSYGTLVKVG